MKPVDKGFLKSRFAFLSRIASQFSFAERMALYALSLLLLSSAYVLFSRVNDLFLVEIPVSGGSFSEGVVGSPRFVNPLLAVSDADRDLTALIYSGLLRVGADGGYVPDVAERYEISEDGLTYAFFLRDDAVFHDGRRVTTEDVEFTIQKAEDPIIKSPKRANWDSVVVEKINEKEIRFHLKQPYAPFLGNATIGILPKHIWKDLSGEEFTFSISNSQKPIGSGPYQVSSVSFDPGKGLPQSYALSAFPHFTLGEPYVKEVFVRFYPNEEALLRAYERAEVDSFGGIDPKKIVELKLEEKALRAPLPRVFGVFFNQSEADIFTRPEVREALDIAADREEIISNALSGFAAPIYSPYPSGVFPNGSPEAGTSEEREARAQTILEAGGWTKNAEGVYERTEKKGAGKNAPSETRLLAFSLATSNASELKQTAEALQKNWNRIGVKVDLNFFELGDLTLNVIRQREYQALLYGLVVGRDLDLYAFWHSSQRNDPGLNIALYANKTADTLLSEAREEPNSAERLEKHKAFLDEVAHDRPAVFLYSPQYIYVAPKDVSGVNLNGLSIPSERFLHVGDWYVETEKVWKWFVPEEGTRR